MFETLPFALVCHKHIECFQVQDLDFFLIFFSLSQILQIPKCRPEPKRRNIHIYDLYICASCTQWFHFISYLLFFSLFPHLFVSFRFVSLVFCVQLENCCLYTNPVLVLNLIQLFLYKSVIIYVYSDVIRCLCVSVCAWAAVGLCNSMDFWLQLISGKSATNELSIINGWMETLFNAWIFSGCHLKSKSQKSHFCFIVRHHLGNIHSHAHRRTDLHIVLLMSFSQLNSWNGINREKRSCEWNERSVRSFRNM